MMADYIRKSLSALLGLAIAISSPEILNGAQASTENALSANSSPTDASPKSAAHLQALVAPIALYPDALVAQILAVSTFPGQVAIANIGANKTRI